MSGKKNAVITWANCYRCGSRFPNKNLHQIHLDDGCTQKFSCCPYISGDDVAFLSLTEASDGKVNELTISKRIADFVLMPASFLKEMRLKTLEWVHLRKCDKTIEEPTENVERLEISGYAIQVWGSSDTQSTKAFVHRSVSTCRPLLTLTPGTNIYQFEIVRNISIAESILFSIPYESTKFEKERLRFKFKTWFNGKIIQLGNVFSLQYLTHEITAQVKDIGNGKESQFFRILEATQINFQFLPSKNDTESFVRYSISLEDLGGLDKEIKELTDTIKYSISCSAENWKGSVGSVPRGVLIYGQHGTGKSVMVRAVCDALNLLVIQFQRHLKIREIFHHASQAEKNVGIIIENLDVLCSSSREGEINSEFGNELRVEMDRIRTKIGIVVLGTACSPEYIPDALRSPQVFGKEIELPVPSESDRCSILRKMLSNQSSDLEEVDIRSIGKQTHGFVGGDLESLRQRANIIANNCPTISHFKEALKFISPSAMKSFQLEIPEVRWEDIGGLDDLKHQLKQSVEWPRDHPEAFLRFKIQPPKGILMYGPPGCSKTMIAKALATESNLNFLSVKGSDLFSKWVGESEKSVRALFRKARQVSPAILFFDELDALGSERGQQGGASNVHERVLAQLLIEIDGIEPLQDVFVVAATNRPDLIDKALIRPGRLDRLVYVRLPDSVTRREIFKLKLKGMPMDSDVDLDHLVNTTEGYTGAEIAGICQEAGLKALEGNIHAELVRMEHFRSAYKNCPNRISKELIAFYDNFCQSHKHDT